MRRRRLTVNALHDIIYDHYMKIAFLEENERLVIKNRTIVPNADGYPVFVVGLDMIDFINVDFRQVVEDISNDIIITSCTYEDCKFNDKYFTGRCLSDIIIVGDISPTMDFGVCHLIDCVVNGVPMTDRSPQRKGNSGPIGFELFINGGFKRKTI